MGGKWGNTLPYGESLSCKKNREFKRLRFNIRKNAHIKGLKIKEYEILN